MSDKKATVQFNVSGWGILAAAVSGVLVVVFVLCLLSVGAICIVALIPFVALYYLYDWFTCKWRTRQRAKLWNNRK